MPHSRRFFLQRCLALLGGLAFAPLLRAAWPEPKFAPLPFQDSLARLLEGRQPTPSTAIALKLPTIAENGAVVPITVSAELANVSRISIVVEKNPVPLAAQFDLAPGCLPFVSARIKMAQTCDVYALVEADGQLYSAKQWVKVTIGGCGG